MIEINNLTFGYSRRHAPVIDDMSLKLEYGNVYGLLGPNGAGKSTLLYLIAGLLTPKSGSVKIDEVNSRLRQPNILADTFIVPEEFELPAITLAKFEEMNGRYYPRFSHEDFMRHIEMFEMSPDLNLGQLSMGQKKKVYMAFALACNTRILLMDEPTNGLDIPSKSIFRRFIASNMNEERLIIISTHQVRDIDTLLDHIIMMNEKTLICSAPISTITEKFSFYTTPNREATDGALISIPSSNGYNIMTLNEGCDDTRVDLELLFQYAMENSTNLKKILSNE